MKKTLLAFLSLTLLSFAFPWNDTVIWWRLNPFPVESSIHDITTVPETGSIICVGSNATIIKSDDQGITWLIDYQPAEISRFIDFNAMHFVNNNLGFVVGNNGTLLKSSTGGGNWKEISPGDKEDFYDVFFINEQTGFITKKDTVLKTVDGGVTWSRTPLPNPINRPEGLYFINDSTGFIGNTKQAYYYKTTDCGNHWDSIGITAINGFSLLSVYFINANIGIVGGVIYNTSSNNYLILRTEDGGDTWDTVYQNYFNNPEHIFFVDALNGFAYGPRIMYDNVILKTNDGGLTWHETNLKNDWWNINCMTFTGNETLFCAGSYGQLFKSTDFGENWNTSFTKIIENANIVSSAKAGDSTIYIGTLSLASGGVSSGTIYRSNDRGETWEKLFTLPPDINMQFINNDFGVVITSMYGSIYKTTNGGENWKELEIDYWDFEPVSLFFIDDQTGFVGGSGSANIYKTEDGGLSWDVSLQNSEKIIDIAFKDDSTGFAICNETIGQYYKTNNQGRTWVLKNFETQFYPQKIYFLNADTGFIIGYDKIMKTTDGGDTWKESTHDIEGNVVFTNIDFPDPNIGFMIATGNEHTTFLRTDDGGDSWFSLGITSYTTSNLNALAFFSKDEGVLLGDNSVIFKTYTGGLVGIPTTKPQSKKSDFSCFPNPVEKILYYDYNLTKRKHVKIVIYNLQGETVAVLINEIQQPGKHSGQWNIEKLLNGNTGKGLYFINFSAGSVNETKKLIVR